MPDFLREPRVAVAIVNWNYARYVADAIRSVKLQTYQNFQCIVLDNGSTDNSAEVIAAAIDGHPQFTVHRVPDNLGHLGGALWLFDRLDDEFVTFLDADDVLSPDYLATHLQVHLAAVSPTGFTSSNCIDINAEGEQLNGGNWWTYHSWEIGEPSLRPVSRALRLQAFDEQAYQALSGATRYLSPSVRGWRWCQGSSNMFRRALLKRVRPPVSEAALFGGVDGYFTPILHAITGTHLIDAPLSAYRVHAANDFSDLPSLRAVRSSRAGAEKQAFAVHLLLFKMMIEDVDTLLRTASPDRYWEILHVVASANPDTGIFSQPEVKLMLLKKYPRLKELFGSHRIYDELRHQMSVRKCLDITIAGHNGRLPLAVIPSILSAETRRSARKVSTEIMKYARSLRRR